MAWSRTTVLSKMDDRILVALQHKDAKTLIQGLVGGEEGEHTWRVERIVSTYESVSRSGQGGHDTEYMLILRTNEERRIPLFGRSYLFCGPDGRIWNGHHCFATTKAIRAASKQTAIQDHTVCVTVLEPTMGQEAG